MKIPKKSIWSSLFEKCSWDTGYPYVTTWTTNYDIHRSSFKIYYRPKNKSWSDDVFRANQHHSCDFGEGKSSSGHKKPITRKERKFILKKTPLKNFKLLIKNTRLMGTDCEDRINFFFKWWKMYRQAIDGEIISMKHPLSVPTSVLVYLGHYNKIP